MSIFDEAVDRAKIAADITAQKTNELIEIAKVKKSIRDLDKAIENELISIGALYLNFKKTGEDTTDRMDEKVEQIDAMKAKLNETKNCLNELRGIKICSACERKNPKDSSFCNSCGAEL